MGHRLRSPFADGNFVNIPIFRRNLSLITSRVKHNLNPSLCRILSCIAHNAEQVSDKRVAFLIFAYSASLTTPFMRLDPIG